MKETSQAKRKRSSDPGDASVQMFDSPLRFLVQSDSEDGVVYLADLGEMRCSCRDWECRRWPDIKAGRVGWRTMCKHLRAALITLGLTARGRLLELDTNKETTND